MRNFKLLPHTGDLRIEIFGKSLPQLFQNAGKAFFSLLTDRRKIKKTQSREITITGENLEELLISFLNELLYLFEIKKLVLTEFQVEKLTKTFLTAQVRGEKYQKQKHIIKVIPKAATYHLLKIVRTKADYRVKVVLDL